jgi:hypothetical protein
MIVPCNQLVCMVIVDDTTNNFDASTLRTVSIIEHNIILSRIPPIFSNLHAWLHFSILLLCASWCVWVVLGNEASRIRNKIGILPLLQNFDRHAHVTDCHLPIVTVKSQMNYLWFDGDDCDGQNQDELQYNNW